MGLRWDNENATGVNPDASSFSFALLCFVLYEAKYDFQWFSLKNVPIIDENGNLGATLFFSRVQKPEIYNKNDWRRLHYRIGLSGIRSRLKSIRQRVPSGPLHFNKNLQQQEKWKKKKENKSASVPQ